MLARVVILTPSLHLTVYRPDQMGMGTRRRTDNKIVAFRKVSLPGTVQLPEILPGECPDSQKLQINVVFTGIETTKAALKRAVDLVVDLDAETRIIVPHVVPFPLPLEKPAVPLEFTCEQIRCLAGSVAADPYVDVYLCRDRLELLAKVLPPGSIVVMGTRKRWFPTKAERMARSLRKQGCDVLLVPYKLNIDGRRKEPFF